ncbi:MAG: endo-1,4-beta-xylanase [candidate division WOR-3 bacterium]
MEKIKDFREDYPLKEIIKDFHIGVALSKDQIEGKEPLTTALVERHFNSITPENILKWEEVHPELDKYNFSPVDLFVEFGEKNRMFMVGHTLVWFYQTPSWVFEDKDGNPLDRESLLSRMKDHIFTVMGRYKGRIQGWDVVNEAIAEDGSFRKCKWLEIIGEDYIQKAFEYAMEADPSCELYYNEYDLEKPPKCEGVIRLLENLKRKGIRIDGVGVQGHWFLDYPHLEEIEAYILAISKLGLKVIISELDVSVLPFYPVDSKAVDLSSFPVEFQKVHNPYPDGLPDSVEEKLADRYSELFSLFRKHRDKIKRVTFWGVHDGQSWRSYLPIRGRVDYPTLFNKDCKPKLAFEAVIKVFRECNEG